MRAVARVSFLPQKFRRAQEQPRHLLPPHDDEWVLLRGIEPAFSIREIGILRYWQELVVPNGRIAELRDHGVLAGDGTRL